MNAIEKYINTDENAIYFFKTFVLDDESKLPFNKQEKYISNAEIFNAIKFLNYTLNGKKIKKNEFWKIISKEITFLSKNKYKHSLPTNIRSLERKYKNYIEIGYISLVHKGYGNGNKKKMTPELEELFLSIQFYFNTNNFSQIKLIFKEFLKGDIDIKSYKTNKIFSNKDFEYTSDVSDATIRNYIKGVLPNEVGINSFDKKEWELYNKFYNKFKKMNQKKRIHLIKIFTDIINQD